MEDRRKHDPKQDEILREVGSIMRTVNEQMTILTRIEQKEDANGVKLDAILDILKNQPGIATSVKTQFEKEK